MNNDKLKIDEEFVAEQKQLKVWYNLALDKAEKLSCELKMPEELCIGNASFDDRENVARDQELFYLNSAAKREKYEYIKEALESLYFARLDIEDNEMVKSYYISKHPIEGMNFYDWRDDVGEAYVDKTNYKFYNKLITLKRDLTIDCDVLLGYKDLIKRNINYFDTIYDDYNNITDPFLYEVLQKRKNESVIRDIITSIQIEQNNLIRLPYNTNSCVLGCAGSGKTMIMFHRLSYLKYHLKKQSINKFNNIIIITPNEGFETKFSRLLSDLEIKELKMSTISQYYIDTINTILKRNFMVSLPKIKLLSEYQINKDNLLNSFYCKETTERIFNEFKKDLNFAFEYFKFKLPNLTYPSIKEKYRIIIDKPFYLNERFKLQKDKIQLEAKDLYNNLIDLNDLVIFILKTDFKKININFNDYLIDCPNLECLNRYIRERNIKFKLDNIKFCLSHDLKKVVSHLRRSNSFVNIQDTIKTPDNCSIDKLKEMHIDLNNKIENEKSIKDKLEKQYNSLYFFNIIQKSTLTEKIQNCNKNILKMQTESSSIAVAIVIKVLEKAVNLSEIIKEKLNLFDEYYELTRCMLLTSPYEWLLGSREVSQINALLQANSIENVDYNKTYNFIYYQLLKLLSNVFSYENGLSNFIFIDEFQELSMEELQILSEINSNAYLNLYGDLNQRFLSKGIKSKEELPYYYDIVELNNNYRNTRNITSYYNKILNKNDRALGIEGPDPKRISMDSIQLFNPFKKDSVIICSRIRYHKYVEKFGSKMVCLIEDAKGLEYNTVFLDTYGMSTNEIYVGYSRAMEYLYIINQ